MLHNIEHTTLFNGQVTVYQPMQGYRFALDSLVLAAFTPAKDKITLDIVPYELKGKSTKKT